MPPVALGPCPTTPAPTGPATLVGTVQQCNGSTTLYWSDGTTTTQAACAAPAAEPVTLVGSTAECDGTTTLYWSNGTTTVKPPCILPAAQQARFIGVPTPLVFPLAYHGVAYSNMVDLLTAVEALTGTEVAYNATTNTLTKVGGGGTLVDQPLSGTVVFALGGAACPPLFPVDWNGNTYATQADIELGMEQTFGVSLRYSEAGCGYTITNGPIYPTPAPVLSATAPPPSLCAEPTLATALSPQYVVAGAAYSGGFSVANATSLALAGVPPGITAAIAPSGTGFAVTLTGTAPAAAGWFDLTFNATNACASGFANAANGAFAGHLTIGAAAAPAVCPAPSVAVTVFPATATVGTAGTWTVQTASATSASLTSLPAWASAPVFNAGAQTITFTGTPDAATAWNLQVTAENACGGGLTTNNVANLPAGTLTVSAVSTPVCPAPGISNAITPSTAQAGVAYTGFLPTTASTTGGTVSGLPAGLTAVFNAGAGGFDVTGIPSAGGSFTLNASLVNACAGGTQSSAGPIFAGTLAVAAVAACPYPSLVSQLSPAVGVIGQAYSGSFTTANTTSVVLASTAPGLVLTGFNAGTGVGTIAGTLAGAPGASGIRLDLTNECGGGATPAYVTGVFAGPLAVSCPAPTSVGQLTGGNAPGATCPAPTVASTVNNTGGTTGVAYTGSIVLAGATSAALASPPAWVTSQSFNASTQTLTFSGTPSTAAVTTLSVSAQNACGSGSTGVATLAGGTLTVAAGAAPAGVVDTCGNYISGNVVGSEVHYNSANGFSSYSTGSAGLQSRLKYTTTGLYLGVQVLGSVYTECP